MSSLEGKLALVTGASRGIGYFTAVELAKSGAHVIAIARTVGGLEELDDAIKAEGGSATLVPLDLCEHDSIDQLGASINERWGKLDAFVCNAAILPGLSPVDHADLKDFSKIMDTNFVASWRLIRSLAPLLQASEAGRAVFMTCEAATSNKPFWGAYAASKAALHSLALTWASECEKSSINVNLFDPGPMRTGLRARAMPGEDTSSLRQPNDAAAKILELVSPEFSENGLVVSL